MSNTPHPLSIILLQTPHRLNQRKSGEIAFLEGETHLGPVRIRTRMGDAAQFHLNGLRLVCDTPEAETLLREQLGDDISDPDVRLTLTSTVRGGGVGRGFWVARILGPDTKFKVDREFLPKSSSLSGSRKSGSISVTINRPGLYEVRGQQLPAGEASIGNLAEYFLVVDPQGETEKISIDAFWETGLDRFSSHERIELGIYKD